VNRKYLFSFFICLQSSQLLYLQVTSILKGYLPLQGTPVSERAIPVAIFETDAGNSFTFLTHRLNKIILAIF